MHVSTNGGYGMNHIYKVVWSKVRNAYVVGAEFISSYTGGVYRTLAARACLKL